MDTVRNQVSVYVKMDMEESFVTRVSSTPLYVSLNCNLATYTDLESRERDNRMTEIVVGVLVSVTVVTVVIMVTVLVLVWKRESIFKSKSNSYSLHIALSVHYYRAI